MIQHHGVFKGHSGRLLLFKAARFGPWGGGGGHKTRVDVAAKPKNQQPKRRRLQHRHVQCPPSGKRGGGLLPSRFFGRLV